MTSQASTLLPTTSAGALSHDREDSGEEARRPVATEPAAKAWGVPRWVIVSAIGAFVVAGAGGYFVARHGLEETDDAQIEGDLVDVSARISGKVGRLLVVDDQVVEAGDVIAELETDQLTQQLGSSQADYDAARATLDAARVQLALIEKTSEAAVTQASGELTLSTGALVGSRAALDQARAAVRAAKSKLGLAVLELSRSRTLLAREAVQQDDVDTHQNAVDSARADYEAASAALVAREAGITSALGDVRASGGRLDAAKAAPEHVANARATVHLDEAKVAQAAASLELARLNLSYAAIRAPVRGQVTRRAVQVGQMVTPEVPLLSLVSVEHVWVVANFKEDQLAKMRPGRPARLSTDTYGSRVFHGHVDTLGATSGARLSLLPAENASGNFVKVVQRVPVRIVLDGPSDVAFRPGTSADVTVDVR
jgi:membrane fusion protein, multidrug efflux system